MRPSAKHIGWKEACELSRCLAEKVRKDDYEPGVIIGIMDGGGFVAGLVAQYLENKRVVCVPIGFYRPRTTETVSPVPFSMIDVHPDIRDRRVLIVDDILDTGSTMRLAVDLFKRDAEEVKTGVLHYRFSETRFTPDYYVENVYPHTSRVFYPWEVKSLAEAPSL